jgi:carboxymethylenebutenolidase
VHGKGGHRRLLHGRGPGPGLRARRRLRRAAPNYGEVPSDAERVLEGICPVVASFGSRDRYLRGHADRLRTALEALGVPHDVKEYEGATHGFMNPHPNLLAKLNALFLPLHYDPAAADDAWARILSFFDTHVRGSR